MQLNRQSSAPILVVAGILVSVSFSGSVNAQGTKKKTINQKYPSQETARTEKNKNLVIETDKGFIHVELFTDKAPKSVANFLSYVKSRHYVGTIFHRVVPGFVVQGGGFTPDMKQKKTEPPVVNESNNGLSNKRGTLAMARRNEPDSATSQFYINLNDNSALDYGARGADAPGYTVFGTVVKGMDVVDAIAGVPLETRGRFSGVPKEPIRILGVTVKEDG